MVFIPPEELQRIVESKLRPIEAGVDVYGNLNQIK